MREALIQPASQTKEPQLQDFTRRLSLVPDRPRAATPIDGGKPPKGELEFFFADLDSDNDPKKSNGNNELDSFFGDLSFSDETPKVSLIKEKKPAKTETRAPVVDLFKKEVQKPTMLNAAHAETSESQPKLHAVRTALHETRSESTQPTQDRKEETTQQNEDTDKTEKSALALLKEKAKKRKKLKEEGKEKKGLVAKAKKIYNDNFDRISRLRDFIQDRAEALYSACCAPPAPSSASSSAGGADAAHAEGSHEHCKKHKGVDLDKNGKCKECIAEVEGQGDAAPEAA